MSPRPSIPGPESAGPPAPSITGVVVHWRGEDELAELVAAWPRDERFELVVVDNGGDAGAVAACLGAGSSRPPRPRVVEPGTNLGFAGGVNAGVAAARAPAVLLLNPDAVPEPGALEALLEGLAAHPEAAGLAPRLVGAGAEPQHRWQLRHLPSAGTLLAQALFVPAGAGPREEPAEGIAVEQPAAAALLLRRSALEAAGGLDEGFYPAWFEDVDLARRLAAAGERIVYWPRATFRHGLGSSVPRLGYGRFLWIYYRNLGRYLRKHHGIAAAACARLLLAAAALARLAVLPLRRPRRARTRREAAQGLAALALGAWSGWRLPRSWARRFRPPDRRTRVPGEPEPASPVQAAAPEPSAVDGAAAALPGSSSRRTAR